MGIKIFNHFKIKWLNYLLLFFLFIAAGIISVIKFGFSRNPCFSLSETMDGINDIALQLSMAYLSAYLFYLITIRLNGRVKHMRQFWLIHDLLIELNSQIEPAVISIDSYLDCKACFLESIVRSADDKTGDEKEKKRMELYASVKDIEALIIKYVSSNIGWNEGELMLLYETNDICREIDRMTHDPVQQKEGDKLWECMWALFQMRSKINKQVSKKH